MAKLPLKHISASVASRTMEHMRDAPPPPRVEIPCADCGKPILTARPWRKRVCRCLTCAVEAPRKRAAKANAKRAIERALMREGLFCETCYKPLASAARLAGRRPSGRDKRKDNYDDENDLL